MIDARTHQGSPADEGELHRNIMHFARVLRAAGLPIGSDRIIAAVEAVIAAGLSSRRDFYWTLHATFVARRDQREVFDQAFQLFWRAPGLSSEIHRQPSPPPGSAAENENTRISARVAEAIAGAFGDADADRHENDKVERDAALSHSDRDVLAKKDFETMTGAELAMARKAIARMRLAFRALPTRRFGPDPRGRRADLRATLREAAKTPDGMGTLRRRSRRRRPPPLVVLCDISGSMDRYTRMMLHFLHALTSDRDRVHSFLFGTRLTNVTHLLRHRDPDVALDASAAAVEDWAGGTRIGACLNQFSRDWSRRVLTQRPIVLLISDGLDRAGGEGLAEEMARLRRGARRLIWLNPLLRYDGYEPRASGARAMIRHVDSFRPIHNLESLAQLADALMLDGQIGADSDLTAWRAKAA